ncbi:hypothetical protein VCHA53O466_40054 [Vibrio chagasii]|nr:hypothetical protein VCHA53O466_40054 [Vibrio chagasii]
MVEQGIENPRVDGSNPSLGTILKHLKSSVFACIAQLVEQVTFNDLVGGSSPPARTILCWL